jgi:hypothetical protein
VSLRQSITTPHGVLTVVQPYAYVADEWPDASPDVMVSEPPYALLNDKPITAKRAREILRGMQRSAK